MKRSGVVIDRENPGDVILAAGIHDSEVERYVFR